MPGSVSWAWFLPCGCLALFLTLPSCPALDCEDLSPFTPVTDEDSVVFSKLTYLGCASVNAPRSEVEALRMMSILRGQCQISLDVTLSVPNVSEGTVRYRAHCALGLGTHLSSSGKQTGWWFTWQETWATCIFFSGGSGFYRHLGKGILWICLPRSAVMIQAVPKATVGFVIDKLFGNSLESSL